MSSQAPLSCCPSPASCCFQSAVGALSGRFSTRIANVFRPGSRLTLLSLLPRRFPCSIRVVDVRPSPSRSYFFNPLI